MTSRSPTPFLAITILLAAATADGDTVTFVSSRDNTLFEDSLGITSNGAGDNFFAVKTTFRISTK